VFFPSLRSGKNPGVTRPTAIRPRKARAKNLAVNIDTPQGGTGMNRQIAILLMFGWLLWFTQEEARPKLLLPTHWSILGQFNTESDCKSFGQKLVDQLGHLPPQKGYLRTTAGMAILDTRRGGSQNEILHEIQTTLYCMSDDIDPRLGTKK
jgi:hypothetical protein